MKTRRVANRNLRMICLAVFSVFLFGCFDTTPQLSCEKDVILGFWHVTNQMEDKGQVTLYAEVNDRSIQYFHPEIDYLPPQYYSLDDSCRLIIYSDSLRTLNDKIVGEIDATESDAFRVNGSTQVLVFNRSSHKDFEKDTGRKWID